MDHPALPTLLVTAGYSAVNEHFLSLIGAIAPVFLVIAVGRLVTWRGLLTSAGIHDLTRLLYWVCLPALLIDRLGRDLPPAGSIAAASALGIIVCLVVAGLMALVSRGWPAPQRGSLINGSFRMNGAFVGLPVIVLLAANQGAGYADLSPRYLLMMAVMVPFTNGLAVLSFLMPGRGVSPRSLAGVGLEVSRNPIILSSLLGILIGATVGSRLAHSPPGAAIHFLGEASIPLALILAGAGLDMRLLRRSVGLLASVCTVKLLLAPALGLALCLIAGLDTPTTVALVVLLGSPTAVSAVPMARQLGGDDRLLSAIVVATTLLSPFTLLLWLILTSGGA